MRDRALLIKKAAELDKQYSEEEVVSNNVLIQEIMAYMRKVRDKKKSTINMTYPVAPPFAFVNIIFNNTEGEFNYLIREPKLKNDEKETLALLRKRLEATMNQEEVPIVENIIFTESEPLKDYLRARYEETIKLYDIRLEDRRKQVLLYYLERELLGLGRSDPVLKDPFIEDISCNGPRTPMYIYPSHLWFDENKRNI